MTSPSPHPKCCHHFYESVNNVPTCSCGATREPTQEERMAPERIKLNNKRPQ